MSKLPTHAMVMAAGLGLRIRAISDLPKPLVPVAGTPLIDRALDWLAASGVQHAVVNTHYRADVIESHLAGRSTPAITISHEEQLLETGGGIVKALPHLGAQPFFSINSDVICKDGAEPVLHRLAARWDDATMDVLLLVQPTDHAIGYEGAGDFFVNDAGYITRRGKKPSAPYVFTGIQMLHPRLFVDTPEGKFSLNVLYDHALTETPPRIAALAHDGAWLHVGDPKGMSLAEAYLQQGTAKQAQQN